jgi:hypothetical protein
MEKLLKKAGADWQVITQLLRENKIKCIEFEGNTYYMRESSGKKKRMKGVRQTRSTTKRIE